MPDEKHVFGKTKNFAEPLFTGLVPHLPIMRYRYRRY